jgi:hypothetical protein
MPNNDSYIDLGSASLFISTTQQEGYVLASNITPASAGPFYYKYTGGNARDVNGILTNIGDFVAESASTFTVSLGTAGYHIHRVDFTGAGNADLSFTRSSDNKTATVTDSFKHPTTNNDYCLKIKDESDIHGNTFFNCDPKIINR